MYKRQGLGGISVLHTIHQMMPGEDLIYIGDSKYNPYGIKTKEEITERCLKICDAFMELGCKAIVIACNTATSAVSYTHLDVYKRQPWYRSLNKLLLRFICHLL